MARIVVDTNVLVSALIKKGKPLSLVQRLLEKHTVVLSSQMLAELADVLSRDKFTITNAQIDLFISLLLRKSTVTSVSGNLNVISEDPDDNIVLLTAINGKADYIVSGDKHLLSLRKFEGIAIVTISQMLEILSRP
ncbi:MAG: putative toxin-antitoxin system toxin component, PIN family [Candidatus Bathyarchaeota archaeon]|nr:putative toxin-antitoxin system toxin component, PIN family [Candidatus Bathyarchaeota archaeon]MDI9577264.1 putative toxin-antitoxin system toxin component, PIN family [Thermoproteota archaeon]MDT8782629.1 putative toxin-antitoxin system toxin component, PIN family [Candidatus Bathyarchaeota archaeon]NLD65865.1 putative toxin-antitoxin system toxin component, PIN family [Thermoproteota archaeon]